MSLVIIATASGKPAQRMLLRPDQRARIGRSPWSELCIDDESLADEHFEVRYGDPPEVNAIHQNLPLQIDGRAVNRYSLPKFGSEELQLQAGQTQFVISWSNRPAASVNSQDSAETLHERALQLFRAQLKSWVEPLSLSDEVVSELDLATSPRQICQALLAKSAVFDAFKLGCRLTTLPLAVEKVLRALRESPACEVPEELNSAMQMWIQEPREPSRRHVLSECQKEKLDGSLRYVADAIRFSGGSLAPDGQPKIQPPPQLPTICLSASIKILDAVEPAFDTAKFLTPWIANLSDELPPKSPCDAPTNTV